MFDIRTFGRVIHMEIELPGKRICETLRKMRELLDESGSAAKAVGEKGEWQAIPKLKRSRG